MSYLLDTNVISELRKGSRCDPSVATWVGQISEKEIFLSVVTLGEIRKGIELLRRRDPRGAASLETWLENLTDIYDTRVLSIDEAVMDEWGRINAPHPLPVLDGLLAATAKVHGLVLVTRNIRDVTRSDVELLNPFG